jgi:hypothetical protein
MPKITMMFDAEGNLVKNSKDAVRVDAQQVDANCRLLSETIYFKKSVPEYIPKQEANHRSHFQKS